MFSRKNLCRISLLMLICFVSAGCRPSLSVGPQTRTEYIILHPGKPMQSLENKTLKGRALDGTGSAVKQDVGGWVFMPPDHWQAVQRALDAAGK